MSEQTICCTCGNVLRVRGATPGASVNCSRCGKPWVVPEPPKVVQRKPAAAPARPPSPGLSPAVLGAIIGGGVLLLLTVVIAVGATRARDRDDSERGSATRTPAKDTPAAPGEQRVQEQAKKDAPTPVEPKTDVVRIPVGTADPEPKEPQDETKITNKDYQAKLDLHIYRLNTAGIVARILELRGKTAEAKDLRESMRGFERSLAELLSRMKAEGHNPLVPGHCGTGDVILHLDQYELARLSAENADKVLTNFAAAIKPGARCRLIVRRNGQPEEFDIIYHERPKELYAILQRADIVPGSSGPDLPPLPKGGATVAPKEEPRIPDGPGSLAILVNASKRSGPVDRTLASRDLADRAPRSRAAAFLAVAAHYLAFDDAYWHLASPADAELQAYFDTMKIVEVETFDAAKHLAAVADLGKRIADVRAKSAEAAAVFQLFAAAHAADAQQLGAGQADVTKAAQAAGLSRTSDGRWGDETSVLKLSLAHEAIATKVKEARARFEGRFRNHNDFGVRYLGVYLVLIETIERNQGGFDQLVAALRVVGKNGPPAAAMHLDALATGIEALARCSQCKNGLVPCPKCGGDGKADVKCPNCDGKGRIDKGNGGTYMCSKCLGAGTFKNVECGCSRTGNKVECPACKGKVWLNQITDASLTSILILRDCGRCRCQGSLLDRVALPCPDCFGLGRLIVPSRDPSKILHR